MVVNKSSIKHLKSLILEKPILSVWINDYKHRPSLNKLLPAHFLNDLPSVHLLSKPTSDDILYSENLVIIASPSDLIEIAPFVRLANQHKKLRALLIHNNECPTWTTQFLEQANLRTLKNLLVYIDKSIPQRIINAWSMDAHHKLIADAVVFENKLLVVDCALDKYEITFDQIKALKSIPKAERKNFTIDADGSGILWSKSDVEINLESIKDTLDPTAAQARKLMHDQKFGQAIKYLRMMKDLAQSEIRGLDQRQIRRIESGEGTTLKSLTILAAAHGMSLKNYLNAVARYVPLLTD